MTALIAHRGWWWPRLGVQNHPASIIAAWEAGYGAEVDVWGVHGQALRVGHDRQQFEFTLPRLPAQKGVLLCVHLKDPTQSEAVHQLVCDSGWAGHTRVFISPPTDEEVTVPSQNAPQEPARLKTIESLLALQHTMTDLRLFGGAGGVWLEQPESDWVTGDLIYGLHQINKQVYVVSSELHGRRTDLAMLKHWQHADGIVTDYPHLLARILDLNDSVVHPDQPWWGS